MSPVLICIVDALPVELLVLVLVDIRAFFPFLGDLHRLEFVMLMIGHRSAPPLRKRRYPAPLVTSILRWRGPPPQSILGAESADDRSHQHEHGEPMAGVDRRHHRLPALDGAGGGH